MLPRPGTAPGDLPRPAAGRTWRLPVRYRITLIVIQALLPGIAVSFFWVPLSGNHVLPAPLTSLILAATLAASAVLATRAWRESATLTPDLLVVRNVFRTRRIPLTAITAVRIRGPRLSGPWAALTVSATGLPARSAAPAVSSPAPVPAQAAPAQAAPAQAAPAQAAPAQAAPAQAAPAQGAPGRPVPAQAAPAPPAPGRPVPAQAAPAPPGGRGGGRHAGRHQGGQPVRIAAAVLGGAQWTGRRVAADDLAGAIAAAAGLPPLPPRKELISRRAALIMVPAGLALAVLGAVVRGDPNTGSSLPVRQLPGIMAMIAGWSLLLPALLASLDRFCARWARSAAPAASGEAGPPAVR